MKKIISLILVCFMVMGFFAGCANNNQNASSLYNPDLKVGDTGGLKIPLSENAQKITWSVSSSNNNLNDSYVVKKIKEATGIDLELVILSPSTALEKIKVLAAAHDLPDIVGQGLDSSFADDLCIQGAFAAVEDYIDVLPNFKRTFVDNKENNWIFKSYAASDGKLYGFYGYDFNRDINTGASLYRKDIFDKHGIKMWHSPETFYQALKQLKELYPDSYPYASKMGEKIFNVWSTSWGLVAQNVYYNEDTKKWGYSDVQPEYKEMLDFMKKLYNEGLMDPEFVTATQSAWTQKMTLGNKSFVTTDWIGRIPMFKEQTKDTIPEYDLRYGNPIGPDQTMPLASQICWARHVSNNDNSETSFKLLDFILSPAGKELITMGIEGETYTIGEDGMAKYNEYPDTVPTITDLEEKYGMFVEGMYLSFDRRSCYFQFSEAEQEAQEFAKDPKNMSPRDPELVFTAEEKENKNSLLSALNKAGKEFSVKYVLNNGGDKEWNEWVKKAEKLGYKDLEKILNDAQKRYDAN